MSTKTKRTQQLITGILSDRQFINSLYDNAQGSFKNYLMRFYNAENDNGTLSVSELRKSLTPNDFTIWQAVLNQYEDDLAGDEEGSLRLQKAKKIAGIDKQSLLNAITAVVIAGTSLKVSGYLASSLKQEYQYAIGFQEREAQTAGYQGDVNISNQQVNKNANNIWNQPFYGLTVNQRVWIKNDRLTSQTNNAVNKGLMKGIDQNYMNDVLFKPFGNSPNSVATIFNHTKGFYTNQLINQEKNRFGASAGQAVFSNYHVKLFDWNLASTHTVADECDDLADGSPYTAEDYPDAPHWGCICYKSPHYD